MVVVVKVCTGSATTSIKHLKITRLFCTSLAGSRIYGLPGMICTLVCPHLSPTSSTAVPLVTSAGPTNSISRTIVGVYSPEFSSYAVTLGRVQSQAKGDSRNATTPVHIYGPEGLAAFIAHMLAISDTFVIVPVLVFEFVPGPVDPQDAEPVLLNERAKVYQVRSPLPLSLYMYVRMYSWSYCRLRKVIDNS